MAAEASMLIVAVVSVTLALLLYTLGVWGAFLRRRLSALFVGFLWAGFAFDALGTTLMSILAGGWKPSFHGFSGLGANLLMALVAGWATVLWRTGATDRQNRYWWLSIGLWILWLVPMVGGAVLGGRY